MEKTAEQAYTDLLRQLASPGSMPPEVLADMFREVERMHSMGRIEDWQMQNAREAYARTTGSRLGDAAKRAADTARNALRSATDRARERTTVAAATYAEKDPLKAMLVAAGVGAIVMGLVAMMARSGVRRVKRRIQS
jgi:ElaB/YqjD/DUF883 family membrane-anchored ribosome-binding protein